MESCQNGGSKASQSPAPGSTDPRRLAAASRVSNLFRQINHTIARGVAPTAAVEISINATKLPKSMLSINGARKKFGNLRSTVRKVTLSHPNQTEKLRRAVNRNPALRWADGRKAMHTLNNFWLIAFWPSSAFAPLLPFLRSLCWPNKGPPAKRKMRASKKHEPG